MSNLRQAAQQALEALEQRDNATLWHQAIHALREALAQQEQEPVAWTNDWLFVSGAVKPSLPGEWHPLYTHPPRREWQKLTKEDVAQNLQSRHDAALLLEERRQEIAQPRREWQEIAQPRREWQSLTARAIEAALKERNHG